MQHLNMEGSLKYDANEALKARILEDNTVEHGYSNGLEIRRVVMRKDFKDTDSLKVQRLSLGASNRRVNKVILLLGVTGGGKTTLINAMGNHFFGVNFKDPYRFLLTDDTDAPWRSQTESQTDLITAYVFNHLPGMPFENNYVLIDTPGLGNTRGIQRDREMMEQMKAFFEEAYGVKQVDCIGIVVPSLEARLTPRQRYVFDKLSSMFGKNVRNNIFVMATFSDDGPPAVTKALEEAKVPYEDMYKFNNNALYASNSANDPEVAINKHNWYMNTMSMTYFFYKLGATSPANLQLTAEVLSSRSRLQACLAELDTLIHISLDKMVTLEKEKAILANFEIVLKECKDYESYIETPRITKLNITGGNTRDIFKLGAGLSSPPLLPNFPVASRSGKGSPNSLSRSGPLGLIPRIPGINLDIERIKERNDPNISLEEVGDDNIKIKHAVNKLMDRYSEALEKKINQEHVIKSTEEDLRKLDNQLRLLIAQAQANERMLKNIALKQDSLSTKDHIDQIIQDESKQKHLLWEKRVEMLMQLRKVADALEVVPGAGRGSVQPEFVDQNAEFSDFWK